MLKTAKVLMVGSKRQTYQRCYYISLRQRLLYRMSGFQKRWNFGVNFLAAKRYYRFAKRIGVC